MHSEWITSLAASRRTTGWRSSRQRLSTRADSISVRQPNEPSVAFSVCVSGSTTKPLRLDWRADSTARSARANTSERVLLWRKNATPVLIATLRAGAKSTSASMMRWRRATASSDT